MSNIPNKLIQQDIIEAMEALDFIVTANPFAVEFKHKQERTCFVSYTGPLIECYHYNDEPEHDRYQLTIRVELKTFPSLSEWIMLMHVGQIIPLSHVMKVIAKHTALDHDLEPLSIFEDTVKMIKADSHRLQLSMSS